MRPESDMDKLGGHLGTICLEVRMGASVTFKEVSGSPLGAGCSF